MWSFLNLIKTYFKMRWICECLEHMFLCSAVWWRLLLSFGAGLILISWQTYWSYTFSLSVQDCVYFLKFVLQWLFVQPSLRFELYLMTNVCMTGLYVYLAISSWWLAHRKFDFFLKCLHNVLWALPPCCDCAMQMFIELPYCARLWSSLCLIIIDDNYYEISQMFILWNIFVCR